MKPISVSDQQIRQASFVGLFLFFLFYVNALFAAETISGRVLNANTGLGIVGVDLDAYDANGNAVTLVSGRSAANGNYTMTVPGPGTYRVRADSSLALGFVDEYYTEVFLFSAATPLTMTANQARTNVNFTLSNGFNISGRVLVNGVGLSGIDIDVYSSTGEFLSGYPALTTANGNYTVGALPPGSYYVRANPDPATGQFQTTRYFPSAATQALAMPIVITNASVANRDITVTDGGTISGIVTNTSGALLAGIDLDVYDLAGVRQDVNAVTKADGSYSLPILPAGSYKIRVDPTQAQGYPRTYYPGVYSLSSAGVVSVTVGATTSGQNFSLPQGGFATGTIRRSDTNAVLAGIDLDVYDQADQRVDITTFSGVDGAYIIGPIAPGSYHMRADPGQRDGFMVQYYNGKIDLATADGIIITSGGTTTGLNYNLTPAGWIEGTVTRSGTGVPLAGIDLDLYNAADDTRVSLNARTAADGTYLLGPLLPGTYKLRCDPTPEQFLAVEYFDSIVRIAEATPIVVVAGAGATGRNFVLDGGGTIRGQITDELTGLPLAGIDIDILTATTVIRLDQSSKTDANGNFVAGPLPAGSYIVRADAPVVSAYADRYFPLSATAGGATVLTITGGTDQTAINIALPPRASLTGWIFQ